MSRIIQKNSQYQIEYGEDFMLGLFIEVYEVARAKEPDRGLVISFTSYHNGLTQGGIITLAEEYGFVVEPSEEIIKYD